MNFKYFFLMLLTITLLISCEDDASLSEKVLDSSTQSISIREVDFCFTSYNIGAFCEAELPNLPGLPESIKNTVDDHGGPLQYGRTICEMLKDMGSDVVNLQEVWCEGVKESIQECMGDEFEVEYNHESGLMTLSKFKIQEKKFTRFEKEKGADGVKNKGFLSTTLVIEDPATEEDCTIELINTHLQADTDFKQDFFSPLVSSPAHQVVGRLLGFIDGDTWDNTFMSTRSIRETQLFQIKESMLEDPCTPIIVAGDLNIDKGTAEYKTMINLLNGQKATLVTPSSTSTSGTTLDYYILSNYDSHSDRFNSMTTTVNKSECVHYEEISKYLVTILTGESIHRHPVASFDTRSEAIQYIINLSSDDQRKEPQIEEIITKICTQYAIVENISDHHPIETCFSEFTCQCDK